MKTIRSPFRALLLTAAFACAHSLALPSAAAPGLFSYETPSYIDFDSPEYNVGAGPVTITLIRTGDFRQYATIDLCTRDGTASSPGQYQALETTLVFVPGRSALTVEIDVRPDASGPGDFFLELTNPGYNTLPVRNEAMVRITPPADSPTPRLAIRPGHNGTIRISWPARCPGFLLERSFSPASGPWEPAPSKPELVGEEFVVQESISTPSYIYRLKQ